MHDYGYLEHMGMGIPRKIIAGMQKYNGTVPELIEDEERFILRLWAYDVLVKFTKTLTFRASATLALGDAAFVAGGMLDVDPFTMSTWNLGVERGERGRGKRGPGFGCRNRFGPNRVRPPSRICRVSQTARESTTKRPCPWPLADVSTSLRLRTKCCGELGAGRAVFEVSYAWDAGHESGRERARIGAAYQLRW